MGTSVESQAYDGSSPRLRGTASSHGGLTQRRRFIPAPAGNSTPRKATDGKLPVHPRACGEQSLLRLPSVLRAGSSPRLRGTGLLRARFVREGRFIPAPAGNRAPRGFSTCVRTVHPRACGEQQKPLSTKSLSAGSSPRLRGTDRADGLESRGCRFIPAPAGNSWDVTTRASGETVHPRACGEQFEVQGRDGADPGSSPRLRGTGQAAGGFPWS